MKVKIYHNLSVDQDGRPLGMLDGHKLWHALGLVAEYESDYANTGSKAVASALDEAWYLFNVGHDPDFGPPHKVAVEYRERGNRSLSYGDVVVVDGQAFSVERWSFGELNARLNRVQTFGSHVLDDRSER